MSEHENCGERSSSGFFQYGPKDTDVDCHYTDYLVGDIEGLTHLRSQIDRVIGGEQVVYFDVGKFDTNIPGILRGSKDLSHSPKSFMDRFADMGCVALFYAVFALVGLGVWKAIELVL